MTGPGATLKTFSAFSRIAQTSDSFSLSEQRRAGSAAGLPAKVCQHGTQWGAGDLNQSFKRLVHLHNEEDGAGDRERGHEQSSHGRCIAGGEETEADEKDRQP